MAARKDKRRDSAGSEPGVQVYENVDPEPIEPKPKGKKTKAPYNEKSAIRGALRTVWRAHPNLQAVLRRERVEVPYVKKDGSISSKPRVFYRCYVCGKLQATKNIQIDHINPVGNTPGTPLAPVDFTWDQFISRLFCSPDNLGTICKEPCHAAKTKAEAADRARRLRELKHVV